MPPIQNYDECIPMLILTSSSPFSSWVPVQSGTTVLDRAKAKITIEEPVHAKDMWQQTYMSTMVMAEVAGTVEAKTDDTPFINATLVTSKPIVMPPLYASE